jgi:cytidylate kinase
MSLPDLASLTEKFNTLPPSRRIITIDGLSGVGSSTISRIIAGGLGARHINAGAYYRTLAYLSLRAGYLDLDLDDQRFHLSESSPGFAHVCELAQIVSPEYHGRRLFHGGQDITDIITTEKMGSLAAVVSPFPAIRAAVKAAQKAAAEQKPTVLEGRVVGKLCEDAVLKVWLTCDAGIRAQRRYAQLGETSETIAEIKARIRKRDAADTTRDHDPATPAKDAIVLSTEALSQDETAKTILLNLACRLGLPF